MSANFPRQIIIRWSAELATPAGTIALFIEATVVWGFMREHVVWSPAVLFHTLSKHSFWSLKWKFQKKEKSPWIPKRLLRSSEQLLWSRKPLLWSPKQMLWTRTHLFDILAQKRMFPHSWIVFSVLITIAIVRCSHFRPQFHLRGICLGRIGLTEAHLAILQRDKPPHSKQAAEAFAGADDTNPVTATPGTVMQASTQTNSDGNNSNKSWRQRHEIVLLININGPRSSLFW